jgi:hypothetical protein
MILIRDIRVGGKKTVTLEMCSEEFSKISHLFTNHYSLSIFRPAYPSAKRPLNLQFSHKGYCWTLYAIKRTNHRFLPGEGVYYEFFGSCGDSEFGRGWNDTSRGGNIRAARDVYNQFLKFIEEQPGTITGVKYGI